MKTFFRLLTLFMAVPVIELALLLKMAQWTGFWPTVALIVVTAVAGSYLAKREGLSAWNRLQGSFSEGGLPGDELLDAVIVLIAGAFLITPGVLTDLVGFIGMVPFTRGWIRRLVKRRLKKAMREGRLQTSFGPFGEGFGEGFGGAPSPAGEAFPGAAASGETASGETASGETASGEAASEAGGPVVGGTPASQGPAPAASSAAPAPPETSTETERPAQRDTPSRLEEAASGASSQDETAPPSQNGSARPGERNA